MVIGDEELRGYRLVWQNSEKYISAARRELYNHVEVVGWTISDTLCMRFPRKGADN
jgi:hypothetical protein